MPAPTFTPPALVIEDGTIVPGANSYVSLADAVPYQMIRLAGTADLALFQNLDTPTQTIFLLAACMQMETSIEWRGRRVTSPPGCAGILTNPPPVTPQPLAWPRIGAHWRDKGPVPPTIVPDEVKAIQALLAVNISAHTGDNPMLAGVRVFRADTFELQFQQNYSPPTIPSYLPFLLNGLGQALNSLGTKRIIK